MVLDTVTAFLADSLGPADGVRLRMVRLALVAAVALPLIRYLYGGLAAREPGRARARWGGWGLWCGVIGMPALLLAAALFYLPLKLLLAVPALGTFAGTAVAVHLAHRQGRRLETVGWVLVATSMAAGLLMGLYAFDGPLSAPAFLGDYNDFGRRLTRLAHAGAICMGLLTIAAARAGAAEVLKRPAAAGRALDRHKRGAL